MSSEEIIRGLFGKNLRDLRVSMINVNSSTSEGTTESSMSTAPKFLEHCVKFYPTILKNYREDSKLNGESIELADKLFMPLWFSPTSSIKNPHPKDFDGDHRSDRLCKEMGLFATHQQFAMWDNATFCAALGSKRKYDSLGVKPPALVVPEEGFTAKEATYVVERGGCSTVGIKTNDFIRYIALYDCSNGKKGVSLICGSHDFLTGQLDILKNLNVHFDLMKTIQKNKLRIGIDIVDASIGHIGGEKDEQLKTSSVAVSRLLGGTVYAHDHLCILKDIYGVKKIASFDLSGNKEISTISIDKLIDQYAFIKQFYVVAKALNSIKNT